MNLGWLWQLVDQIDSEFFTLSGTEYWPWHTAIIPQIFVEPSSGLSSVAIPVVGVILLGAKAALAVVIPRVAVVESALSP